MIFHLLILSIISASGLLLFLFKKVNQSAINLLIGLGAGSMLSVSLVHIFPEALEQTEYAVYAFIAGFLLIYIVEEILTPHAQDHGPVSYTHLDVYKRQTHSRPSATRLPSPSCSCASSYTARSGPPSARQRLAPT